MSAKMCDWEVFHNPDFKVVEFYHFRMSTGLLSFVLSASKSVNGASLYLLKMNRGIYKIRWRRKFLRFPPP